MSLPESCVETLCSEVAELSVKPRAPRCVPIAGRTMQVFALWLASKLPSATEEIVAQLETRMRLFDSVQDQLDFLAEFDPDAELKQLAARQQAAKPAAAKAPRKSPAKGEKPGAHALQVRTTRTSLDGRPALVDETGTYYEPVAIARAPAPV